MMPPGGPWMGGGPMGFMSRLDTNGNGMLDPEESQGRARMFLERTGLDLSRPIPMDQVGRAFEEMRSRRMGEMGGEGGRDRGDEWGRGPDNPEQGSGSAAVEPLVPGFGEPDLFDPVPGFGDLGERFAVSIEEQDRQEAQRTMGRSDANQDGILDADEIRGGRWGDDPLQTDRNRDGKLTLNELALRYAIRRVEREGDASGSRARSGGGTSGDRANPPADAAGRAQERMVQMAFGRYDRNGNGVLEKDEWDALGPDPSSMDANRDGRITRDEFAAAMVARFGGRGRGGEGDGRFFTRREGEENPPGADGEAAGGPGPASGRKSLRLRTAAERLAELEGLPEWFARTDANGDGQVQMSEYATSWSEQVVADFSQFDLNGDGIVTPGECLKAVEAGAVQGGVSAAADEGQPQRDRRGRRDRGGDAAGAARGDAGRREQAASDAAAPAAPTRSESPEPSAAAAPAAEATKAGAATAKVPPKYITWAVGNIAKYDTNKDGVLTQDEWTKMNTDYSSADTDQDGRITPVELGAAVMKK